MLQPWKGSQLDAISHPAAITRSPCSLGMVRCIGLVPTSFKEQHRTVRFVQRSKERRVRHFIALVMSCCCHGYILLPRLLVRNGGSAWNIVTNYRGMNC